MPSSADFSVRILVAGIQIPEYEKDGEYFVECNLTTPYSYKTTNTQHVNGEIESQAVPVTPYSIKVTHKRWERSARPRYFRIMVDGVKVKGLSLEAGASRVIKGFRDGPCIREFLFAMPRFAIDTDDRVSSERYPSVGKIEVECWNATLRKTKWGLRRKFLDFEQANKKDSTSITQGKYMMATSTAGKVISSRSLYRSVDSWKLQTLRSKLTITYHMGHTLQDMGFTLQPFFNSGVGAQSTSRQHESVSHTSGSRSSRKRAGKSSTQSKAQQDTDSETELLVVKEEKPDITGANIAQKKQKMDVVDLTLSDSDDDDDSNIASTSKPIEIKEEPARNNDIGKAGKKTSKSKHKLKNKQNKSNVAGEANTLGSGKDIGEKETESKDGDINVVIVEHEGIVEHQNELEYVEIDMEVADEILEVETSEDVTTNVVDLNSSLEADQEKDKERIVLEKDIEDALLNKDNEGVNDEADEDINDDILLSDEEKNADVTDVSDITNKERTVKGNDDCAQEIDEENMLHSNDGGEKPSDELTGKDSEEERGQCVETSPRDLKVSEEKAPEPSNENVPDKVIEERVIESGNEPDKVTDNSELPPNEGTSTNKK